MSQPHAAGEHLGNSRGGRLICFPSHRYASRIHTQAHTNTHTHTPEHVSPCPPSAAHLLARGQRRQRRAGGMASHGCPVTTAPIPAATSAAAAAAIPTTAAAAAAAAGSAHASAAAGQRRQPYQLGVAGAALDLLCTGVGRHSAPRGRLHPACSVSRCADDGAHALRGGHNTCVAAEGIWWETRKRLVGVCVRLCA